MSFSEINLQLFEGFGQTLFIFAMTLVFSLPLGLVIAFGSMSKLWPIKKLTRIFVWGIRGTPLMLQLFIVYYVPGLLFNMHIQSRMLATLIAFVINYSAYFSEIFRGGIESISQGQYEAGYVLGMTKRQIFFKVILLQVIKRILPPMSNEIITLVKDTSLARVISIVDIIRAAELLSAKGLIWPLFYTGVFFLLFSGLLSLLFSYVEKKLDYFKG